MTSMSQHEQPLLNVIHAATDAILAGNPDLDGIARQYGVARGDVEPYVRLIQRLHVTLVGVQPSKRFVQRLRTDLVGEQPNGVFARIRYLPPRVQIAAGIALVAGFMLLARRRLSFDALAEAADAAVGALDVQPGEMSGARSI